MVIKKHSGFVLLSVLIITTVTTMLAFSQVNNNLLQERIGGHQQKELNARLAAEKGVFNAFDYIKAQNAADKSNTEIEKALLDTPLQGQSYSVELIKYDENVFTLLSKGVVNGATTYLKTEITLEAQSIFDDAIVACDGVKVSGNGNIDSFAGAAYASNSAAEKGDATAIKGSIELQGNGSIFGDVIASGSITNADNSDGGNVTGEIKANYSGSLGQCDPLAITKVMADIAKQSVTSTAYTPAEKTTTTFDGSTVDGVTPVALTALSENAYVFSSFTSEKNKTVIEISGDVTFYIEGDMSIKNTTFTLADSSSSLTIYIAGRLSVDTGSDIFENNYTSGSHVPLTVYSSNTGSEVSNASTADTAVNLTGNGEIYMNLYAPQGAVSYKGHGNIMGALRGKVVDISGNGGMHYDEGLSDIDISEEETSIAYSSIYDHYP